MKKVTYKCDRCGDEIDSVVYTLTCYADDLNRGPYGGISAEVCRQNYQQNQVASERHLCGKCKDEITDGIFIV